MNLSPDDEEDKASAAPSPAATASHLATTAD
jgi:hypothetical protein